MKYKKRNISSLEDISELLGVSVSNLIYLSNNMIKNTKETKISKKGSLVKKRTITAPSRNLKIVQRKIKETILDTHKYKSYIFGLGGNTLKQHAKIHEGDKKMVQVDLKDFYPSIKHDLVYVMWLEKFKFNPDASRILTKLTTMGGGLKQGFPTSSHIAAIVAEDFTSGINDYCNNNKLKFSQYVDDLNISGDNIDYRMIFKTIIPLGRKFGLTIKRAKTKVNARLDGKIITGVSLFKQQTRATKTVRHKAIEALKDLASSPKDDYFKKRVAGYLGFLNHLNKNDGNKYKKIKKNILPK